MRIVNAEFRKRVICNCEIIHACEAVYGRQS